MRIVWAAAGLLVLAACQPDIPDSGASVGYDAQSQAAIIQGMPVSEETLDSGGAEGEPTETGVAISDEQDFSAVASRETIESDAARIAANREQYQQVMPTALPERDGKLGPSIVAFALSTTNPIGVPLYHRSKLFAEDRFNRSCAKYPSADKAQEAFLAAGGPERDPMGMDPDGDGFACYWDPAPFRLALGMTAPDQ